MSEDVVPGPNDPTVVFTIPGTDIRVERYAVSSNTEDQPHGVTVVNGHVWSCTCLGFRYRWREPTFVCRHMKIIHANLTCKRREPTKAIASSKTTVESVLATIEFTSPKQGFSPSRYPYTYAADLLRGHPEILPAAVLEWALVQWSNEPEDMGWSRSFASRVRERWAEVLDCSPGDLAEVLAYAYLVRHNVDVPSELQKPAGVGASDS